MPGTFQLTVVQRWSVRWADLAWTRDQDIGCGWETGGHSDPLQEGSMAQRSGLADRGEEYSPRNVAIEDKA